MQRFLILFSILLVGCVTSEPTTPTSTVSTTEPVAPTEVQPTIALASATPSPPTETPVPTSEPTNTPINTPTARAADGEAEVVAWLQENVVPFDSAEPSTDCTDLQPMMEMIGDAQVVGLGEGTHGTREFFTMKHRIVQCLVIEQGFTHFVIEADMAEAYLVNEYVLTGEGDPAILLAGLHFWTWNTEEVLDMIEWMRAYNAQRGDAPPIQFLGFDMQFPRLDMDRVIAFVAEVAPDQVAFVEEQYDCIYQPLLNGESYKEVVEFDNRQLCEANIQAVSALLDDNQEAWEATSGETFARVRQHARIVEQAEKMYSANGRGRDPFMAENLLWLLEQAEPEAKFVLWAHNLHISDSFHWMGSDLRDELGDNYVPIGFSFYAGTLTAWDADVQSLAAHQFLTPDGESYEAYLHAVGIPRFYFDARPLRADSDEVALKILSGQLPFYSTVGAVYDEVYLGHKTNVSHLYDIMIYFENTNATELLPRIRVHDGQVIEEGDG